MRRFVVVALLAFAFIAAPIGALCSSCCPEEDPAQKLGAAMPCCAEECAPTVSGAQSSTPAMAATRTLFGFPLVLVITASSVLDSDAVGVPSVLGSPSPPPDVGALFSVLRL